MERCEGRGASRRCRGNGQAERAGHPESSWGKMQDLPSAVTTSVPAITSIATVPARASVAASTTAVVGHFWERSRRPLGGALDARDFPSR